MVDLVRKECDRSAAMNVAPRWFSTLCVLVVTLLSPLAASAQVIISEFLADNQLSPLTDSEGDHADWLELWNTGNAAVSLNGWYLTDSASDLRRWQFPTTTPAVGLAPGERLVIFASGKNRRLVVSSGTAPKVWGLHTNFKLSKSAGSYLGLVRPDGLTVEHSYASYPQQVQDIPYGVAAQLQWQTLVPAPAQGRAKVPLSAADMPVSSPITAADWRHVNFDDTSWQAGETGFGYDTAGTYGTLIGPGGDLQTSMYLQNSTALIRIKFQCDNPGAVAAIRLSMKYDDGFNCYLNGTSVQSSLSGGTAWNSGAVLDRNGQFTSTYGVFNPANAHSALIAGTNVFTIQLLNKSNGTEQDTDSNGTVNGSRALALPLLEGNFNIGIGTAGYLSSATPGAANSALRTGSGAGAVGPGISDTTSRPPRPVGNATSAPITITTKISQTLRPLATVDPVKLYYRVNYATEQIVIMRDNGVAPDAAAGDQIFTANLPTANAGVGQMIRWRVSAADSNNVISTEPPYLDTTDNEQFFGTVTQDAVTTSQVPVLHWFVQNASSSRTTGGTRCSLFYLDRFYDNVFVNLHGQSSGGFAVDKKSHNFNFNEDNRFKWKDGEKRNRAINLITTWADKSRVRDTLAWETWQYTKHIASHWAIPVRVQQNGGFWGIYDMVENGDEDFVERAGLDPYGALYKCYNTLDSAAITTTNGGGVEKKTRDFDTSTADLQAVVDAMNTANSLVSRRSFAYDNLDVPSLVNYLATNVLLINNDFGHKNYYIYRDTNGTREWSLLPWDQDLSIGHTWTSVQNYFNDDIDSQRGLIMGASTSNRVMNLIMNSNAATVAPEMAQMFQRRLRTLMDQLLVSATATDGPFEQRINQLLNNIDPIGATFQTDADLDLQKWGYWIDGSGAPISPNNNFDAATHDHGARRQAMRIMNSNPNPPYPAAVNNAEGLGNTTFPFLTGRRSLLYNGNLTLVGFPIPQAQPAVPTGLVIEHVEFNPGNQDQEYFVIRNNSSAYVDISGWKIKGGVEHTFLGGTVIPPFTSNSALTATGDVHAGRLHVARNPYQFRQRTTAPRGGQFRLVSGPYNGQLSARGESLRLVIPGPTSAKDVVVASTTFAGAPTPAQEFLRVTELSYHPAAPTTAELAALPGVQASDFEFIELVNSGSTPLNIGGARFTKGIEFTFPANFTLNGGQRCILVSLQAAFNLRYGNSGALVAGQFEGNLDNSGETLQILDNVGESVLEFTYNPRWFGIPDATHATGLKPVQGYSLVANGTAPVYNGYNTPTNWSLGGVIGGTPGTMDTVTSNALTGWSKSFFTSAEEANPAISGAQADADNDGRSNFEEYAFGGNPRTADTKPSVIATVVTEEGTRYLAVTYTRRRNALDTSCT